MKCPYCIKQCNTCNKLLVAYKGNFHKAKRGKYGFQSNCKECSRKKERDSYRLDKKIRNNLNPFDNINVNKTWNNCPFCIKICSECGEILVAYEGNFQKRNSCIYRVGKKCRKCKKIYNKNNYLDNSKELCERQKEYGRLHKEERAEYNKQWALNNPEKVFNIRHKRRLREENQGSGITKEQWYEMMEFFNWECAYSGIQLSKNNRNVDHIIPLSKNGENEIWNLVPCYSNYNYQKHARNMLEWYKEQAFYSENRLMKIYEWQEYAFEKWGKNND